MRSTASKVLPWRKQISSEAVHHHDIVPAVNGLIYPIVRPDEPLWYIAQSPPFAPLPSSSAILDETVLPLEGTSHWSSSSSSFTALTGDEHVMMQDGFSPRVSTHWSDDHVASTTTNFGVPSIASCTSVGIEPGTIPSNGTRKKRRRCGSNESASPEAVTTRQSVEPTRSNVETRYHREKLNLALDDLRCTLASTEAFGREISDNSLLPAAFWDNEVCWRHRSDLVRDAIKYIQMAEVEIRHLREEKLLWLSVPLEENDGTGIAL
ncbi:uncharacterized protein AB675_10456 [Cyphellophora attinorum]|uniref:BHLH domain-containing protein n=1 Tax=Cyphellophora attinorum TaxID=1664694 RepID=A0A0N1H529_9EURO|nr:uncharacterized protein AB675_10456 [Phialophora attinorum]KPI35990.1 hypothetical protein AB675_10456 [Phialophora attinorum]